MKKCLFIFLWLMCVFSNALFSQAPFAPITTVASIVNATTIPADVIVPVTVTDFTDIGNIKLTLLYQSTCVTYISATLNPAFTGMTVNSATPGKLIITWNGTTGVTLPDQTHLLDLTFTYVISTSSLQWEIGSTTCKYKKYAGGSYTACIDQPYENFYINGGVSNRSAPITIAAVTPEAIPGNYPIQVMVVDFSSISAISFSLEYDPDVLTYLDTYTINPVLASGVLNIGNNPGDPGKMNISLSWFGGTVNLPDSSILISFDFSYSNTNAGYSTLRWVENVENGSTCEYGDEYGISLLDSPTSYHYKNGLIYSSNQFAPQTWLPVITNPVPSGTLAIPVNVNNFSNISSFTLSFEYDTTAMTYNSYVPHTAFGTALSVANNLNTGSKRKIVISYSGTSPMSLPDASSIVTLNFQYLTGTSPLTWLVDDAISCRFNDSNGNAYYDLPKSSYYQNGIVAPGVAPRTVAWYASPTLGQQFTVPVIVYDFSGIGLFKLTLDFDPGVLTYQGATLVPAIGGTFSAVTAGSGRVVIDWSGTPASLPDSSDLINLTFTYNGGSTALTWFDNGNSCKYAGSLSGASLYDQPRSNFYINGYIGPNPLIANFSASTLTCEVNDTIAFIDLTTGGPTSWNWSISPSTYYFVNGTNAYSQNPQVRFTSNGAYTIILFVSRESIGSMKFKQDYIHAGISGLWTGITSIDWNTASNWHNYLVPGSTVDVLIPASATFWPHINGNLSLGIHCNNITLEGASQLTVDGNLTMNAGTSLTFTGSGTLILGGNWSNSGVFNAGTSIVNFTGPNDASILGGASPETFYKIVLSKTNANLSVQGFINVIGTENK